MKPFLIKSFDPEICSFFASLCPCFQMPFMEHTLYCVTFVKQIFSNFFCRNYQIFCWHPIKLMFIFACKQCIVGNIWLDNLNCLVFPALKLLVQKSSRPHSFPHLANICRSHIEFLSLQVSNPSFFGFSWVCSHKRHLKKHEPILKLFVMKRCSKIVKLVSSNDAAY